MVYLCMNSGWPKVFRPKLIYQAINLSPPPAPELLEGFSFCARGTRVNRPWHIGSEIITALYNRFYRKNKFYFPLLSSSWLNIGETWRKIIERSQCCINFCQSVWRNKSWCISYNTRVVSWPIIKFRVMYFERSGWEIIFLDLISFISVCNFPWSRQNLTMNKENRKFASPCLNNLPTKSIFYRQPRDESGGKIWLFIIVPVSASLRWNSCNNATKNEPNELWVPRTINWLMNEVKQINQDQAESTRRSNWTLSFFPSMLPDQLCFPWVTYSGELSWKFTQNLSHFYRRFHSNFSLFQRNSFDDSQAKLAGKRLLFLGFDQKIFLQPCKSVGFSVRVMTGFASLTEPTSENLCQGRTRWYTKISLLLKLCCELVRRFFRWKKL